MNNRNLILALLAAAATLEGCTSLKENVVFVTKTSLGIDFDGTPPAASIAYDRTEGYFGPRYENGAVPPVVAKISSDGGIFDRNVKQYYATGTASNLLTGSSAKTSATSLKGDAKPMFFGTSTTLGIKIGFTTTLPDSFTFGYRRKEASLIPLGHITDSSSGTPVVKHAYPSVIGVFTTDTKAKTPSDSSFGLSQFFATGTAAEALAADTGLQRQFKQFAKDAVGEFKDAERDQQKIVLSLLTCFTRLDNAHVHKVLQNAEDMRLFPPNAFNVINAMAAKDKQTARFQYTTVMTNIVVDPPERTFFMEGHRVFVCGLLKNP